MTDLQPRDDMWRWCLAYMQIGIKNCILVCQCKKAGRINYRFDHNILYTWNNDFSLCRECSEIMAYGGGGGAAKMCLKRGVSKLVHVRGGARFSAPLFRSNIFISRSVIFLCTMLLR